MVKDYGEEKQNKTNKDTIISNKIKKQRKHKAIAHP